MHDMKILFIIGENGQILCWSYEERCVKMTKNNRRFNLNEVLSMLEDDNTLQRADIHINPHPVDDVTDEDSGEEDGNVEINNLPGRQLDAQAFATIIRPDGRSMIGDEEDQTGSPEDASGSDTDSYEIPDNIPLAGPSRAKRPAIRVALREPQRAQRTKRPIPTKRKWKKKKDITPQQSERFVWRDQIPDTERLPQTPDGIFQLFFDEDVIDMIVEHSKTYAGFKGNHNFTVSPDEIRVFLAILLISGYSTVPRRRMFWSNDTDLRNEAIISAMTRDRFDQIMRYLHVSDNNNLDEEDKFSKVRPLLALLNERFLIYFRREKNLSIDESMIPYFGRHGAKQFIRGKPIRFGYKMWALTTALGYVLQFEPYQGARGRQTQDDHHLGMGGSVVVDLLSELTKDNGYHLTFDNLFTSLRLVDKLSSLGIACTGTIRANRIEDCPVRTVNEMQKTPRGTYDYAYDESNGLVVIRWNDNNIVNVVSNQHGVAPVQTASRWSRADRQRIRINQPFAITHYNRTMGGVDRMDQNVGIYRVGIRSKKWWWPVFAYCLDLAVQQTCHLYRATTAGREQPLDLLGVRRAIVKVFLACGQQRANRGRPKSRSTALHKQVLDNLRLDRKEHYASSSKQRRCALCAKHCNTSCTKCNVGLHHKCFIEFHTI